MTPQNKLSLEYRVNPLEVQDSFILGLKAKEFTTKVHLEQENLLGKQLLRKKKE